eukprot:GSA25T00021289001.1
MVQNVGRGNKQRLLSVLDGYKRDLEDDEGSRTGGADEISTTSSPNALVSSTKHALVEHFEDEAEAVADFATQNGEAKNLVSVIEELENSRAHSEDEGASQDVAKPHDPNDKRQHSDEEDNFFEVESSVYTDPSGGKNSVEIRKRKGQVDMPSHGDSRRKDKGLLSNIGNFATCMDGEDETGSTWLSNRMLEWQLFEAPWNAEGTKPFATLLGSGRSGAFKGVSPVEDKIVLEKLLALPRVATALDALKQNAQLRSAKSRNASPTSSTTDSEEQCSQQYQVENTSLPTHHHHLARTVATKHRLERYKNNIMNLLVRGRTLEWNKRQMCRSLPKLDIVFVA